jgi:hypothetical protein
MENARPRFFYLNAPLKAHPGESARSEYIGLATCKHTWRGVLGSTSLAFKTAGSPNFFAAGLGWR